MAETHTKERRIVDETGNLLFRESTQVLVDGDDVRVDSERRVKRCPNCGSRLDQAKIIGRCWECSKQVCTNCGTKAACCGRTLCEDHRHLSVLGKERIWVCSEHESTVSTRQAFYDANVLFEQRMKERIQQHEEELRKRDIELKEFMASSQRDLALRQQAHKEEVQRLEGQLRLRDMKLKEYIASFQKVLGCRQQSYQEALARQRLYFEHARLRIWQMRAIAPGAYSLLANHRQAQAYSGRRG